MWIVWCLYISRHPFNGGRVCLSVLENSVSANTDLLLTSFPSPHQPPPYKRFFILFISLCQFLWPILPPNLALVKNILHTYRWREGGGSLFLTAPTYHIWYSIQVEWFLLHTVIGIGFGIVDYVHNEKNGSRYFQSFVVVLFLYLLVWVSLYLFSIFCCIYFSLEKKQVMRWLYIKLYIKFENFFSVLC